MVRAYPVSVEWPSRRACESPPIETCRQAVRRELDLEPDVRLCVGVDRMDYTKGIDEKFLAVERLLEWRPELRGRFVFVQVAEPSRECLPAYRDLRLRLLKTAERINVRFGAGTYRPIVLLEAHHEPEEVYRFFRAADLCYVGSLHDGMNLVAKEFVSARDDERGVLILSRFTGAARQLAGALIVNPYAIDDSAHVLMKGVEHAGSGTVAPHAEHAVQGRGVQYLLVGRPVAAGRVAAAADGPRPSVGGTLQDGQEDPGLARSHSPGRGRRDAHRERARILLVIAWSSARHGPLLLGAAGDFGIDGGQDVALEHAHEQRMRALGAAAVVRNISGKDVCAGNVAVREWPRRPVRLKPVNVLQIA